MASLNLQITLLKLLFYSFTPFLFMHSGYQLRLTQRLISYKVEDQVKTQKP
jgi:hypothetical protein